MKLSDYDQPSVTVDLVVFTIKDKELKILLIKRASEPFRHNWALPGGFVRVEESLIQTATRELYEETGVKDIYIEQLYTFGEPARDPRGRVITVAYLALINSQNINLKASTDAIRAEWWPVTKLPSLAFDHKRILNYALKRLKWKFEYTTIAFSLLKKNFSLGELQSVYEIVFGIKIDKRNFRKKILSLNILKKEHVNLDAPYRPPQLYSVKNNIGKIINMKIL